MKKNIVAFILAVAAYVHVIGQDSVALNVVYEFTYVRDLEDAGHPYKVNMVLSLGRTSSRYSTEKLFNDNDKKAVEARRREQERLESASSGNAITVTGGPMLIVGKYGAVINEEINKKFATRRLSIDAKVGIRLYHVETDLPEIKWTLLQETKKIKEYDCQKATATFGGRTYTAWFTAQLPYHDGPWKLHGLPGLILEACDTANEVFFTAKEISKNLKETEILRSFLQSTYSIKTNVKDLAKAKAAFETDPEGVMSAQAPNAEVRIKNIDDPNDKRVLKIRRYNPMEK